MIKIEEYQKMIEEAKASISKLSEIHEAGMKILANEDPEKFAEISKDFEAVRTTKDINTLNEILNRYANSSNAE
jgi:hypothetical protein